MLLKNVISIVIGLRNNKQIALPTCGDQKDGSVYVLLYIRHPFPSFLINIDTFQAKKGLKREHKREKSASIC